MRRFFIHNIELKLAAIAFAFVLWLIVGARSETNVSFLVPVGFKGVPVDMAMASRFPENIEVKVSGPRDSVKMLSSNLISVEIDLSAAKEGISNYVIKPGDVKVPGGLEAVEVKPSGVEVNLERLAIRTVPIKAVLEGRLDEGQSVASVAIAPAEVEVIGRQSEVNALTVVETRAIDVSGMKSSQVVQAFVNIPDGAVRVEPQRVAVAIRIGKTVKGKAR